MVIFLVIIAGSVLQIALACLVGHRLRTRTVSPEEAGGAVIVYATEELGVVMWKEEEFAADPGLQTAHAGMEPAFTV